MPRHRMGIPGNGHGRLSGRLEGSAHRATAAVQDTSPRQHDRHLTALPVRPEPEPHHGCRHSTSLRLSATVAGTGMGEWESCEKHQRGALSQLLSPGRSDRRRLLPDWGPHATSILRCGLGYQLLRSNTPHVVNGSAWT
ncbi:hypothetical protein HDA42_000138 [Streptomyces costaricanus]|uniref:Uncharacterized protein n=1 Tax=Streptomyces murinus TaxID=33900 RepID=A0A7W3NIA9_STRMR|nr:hypothetical protein [Streptomyces murinus]